MAAITEDRRAEVVPKSLIEAARNLVATTESSGKRLELKPLASGGNNRVFLVESESARYVAKWYYHDTSNTRDRARAEFEFLSHLWGFGIRNIPRPIACDPRYHLAIYEFVSGRHVRAADLTPALIDVAARFFATINARPVRAAAAHLPVASDACFTIDEHIRSVDRRIERLSTIQPESPADREAVTFTKQLAAAWSRVRDRLLADTPDIHGNLPDDWRSLSPSDFGFHNAILREGGEICFLDFEYAGWDDPAKMIGDFFSHPGMPVPNKHLERFASLSLEPFSDRAKLAARVHHLIAVSRMRWCCIILNEFLPDIADRRQFADPTADISERKQRQLIKAHSLLAAIDI
ncbi:MAG: aminoglycoside phosphotransferase family protein [Methyloceanibacter sp.]